MIPCTLINMSMLWTSLNSSKPLLTPMSSHYRLSKFSCDTLEDTTMYRQLVKGLKYCVFTHLEIAFTVSKLCQFLQSLLFISNPSNKFWDTWIVLLILDFYSTNHLLLVSLGFLTLIRSALKMIDATLGLLHLLWRLHSFVDG